MKVNTYLLLPVVATLCNVIFVHFCLPIQHVDGFDQQQSVSYVQQQRQDASNGLLTNGCRDNNDNNEECMIQLQALEGVAITGDFDVQNVDGDDFQANATFTTYAPYSDNSSEHDVDNNAKDPMLRKIPGLDFEAYVRADIATFYRKEPGTMVERPPVFQGQAGKFVNMSPNPVALYWVGPDGSAPISSIIPAWGSGGTSTFPGHKFVFVDPKAPNDPFCTFSVIKGTSVYYYNPYAIPANDESFDPARCVPPKGTVARNLDELSAEAKEKYRAHKFNFAFASLYKNFTGGSEWLSMYPRNKPLHKMWRADYFGQEHVVETRETQFHTDPGAEITEHTLSIQDMRRNYAEPLPLADYRHPGSLNLTIKAISCAPRAFEIQNFLSDVEVDHILNLVKKQSMQRSSTGDGTGGVSSTRTSRNTWIPRHKDMVLNSIYQRAADALRLDEALLRRRERDELPDFPTKSAINEDLQTVHYGVGQEYTAHHDFSFPLGNHPDSPSRSINLCMYLNDVPAGGETAFPRWRNGETVDAIKVTPKKGKAIIFYMINPDGNLDDLTQHAAMPVIEGEKYFVNLWIHDPIRT
ncbi:hypothetical protein ACA910_009250 [Epithemia clementina (nom. ined.)]